ncbi:MAG: hypothetical protein LBG21_04975 [Campylobacteraceae bacterium]|nr:hypothetical protein [Campylobacteraceae bacterium]
MRQKILGVYRFKGKDISHFKKDELARLRRESFGFIFQSYHLIHSLTAVENVEVLFIYYVKTRKNNYLYCYRLFVLSHSQ